MNQWQTIAGFLEKLEGRASLKLEEGALKDYLSQGGAPESLGTLPVEGDLLELSLAGAPAEGEPPGLTVRLRSLGEERTLDLPAAALQGEALQEIALQLERLAAPAPPPVPEEEECDTYGMVAAANRLRVATTWLKSVVPCTYYSYEEVDGRKKIKEYFWSKELIRVLHLLRSKKATPQEVQYIADHCCEGDLAWSRDIIARLKAYNRSQTAPQAPKPLQPQGKQQRPPRSDAERRRSPRTPGGQ